jgi:glycosyltransferase involved in cell wall biosynthesis
MSSQQPTERVPPESATAPAVSVVCCTHNREGFARTHFESMRRHLGENIELVYALDNCTDNTLSTLQGLTQHHANVRVLEHRGERGLFNCRNFGIAHAQGRYIHFLDDDDSVEPGFYSGVCAGLKEHPTEQPDIYLTRLRVTSDDGHQEEKKVLPDEVAQQAQVRGEELHLQGDWFAPIFRGQIYFNGANALYSKALLQRYGYRSELKKSADWLFILEATISQRLYLVYHRKLVANYYVHAASMSISPDKAVWNARVFELLLDIAKSDSNWIHEIRERSASANFHAGFALRRTDRRRALRHYLYAARNGHAIRSLAAILKLAIPR